MRISLIVLLCLLSISGLTQERVTTFGVAVKPIIPSNLLRSGVTALSQNGIDYSLDHRVGYSFGGVMRFGMTNWFSMETGISYVRRNFSAIANHDELNFSDTVDFRVIGYEIPVMGMVFVQLADEVFMNTSFGLALDMFPSDVGNGNSSQFGHVSVRRGFAGSNIMPWTKLGLLANIGFEYRTEEAGYFYIGASYHRPFQPIYNSNFYYEDVQGNVDEALLQMSGNYLTFDIRYFFHEEPKERKVERDPATKPSWMRD